MALSSAALFIACSLFQPLFKTLPRKSLFGFKPLSIHQFIFFVTLIFFVTFGTCCDVERCSTEFEQALMTGRQANLNTPSPITKAEQTAKYCRPLNAYYQC